MRPRQTKKVLLILFTAVFASALLAGCSARTENVHFNSDFSLEISGAGSYSRANKIDKALSELENAISAALPGSDVGRVNAAPVGEPIRVGEDFAYLYELCLYLYNQTPAFNPFIFPLVELWKFDPAGFTLSPQSIPTAEQINGLLPVCGADSFSFDPETRTVTKLKEGAKLDFGQSAKGYAADIAAGIAGGNEYVVNVGGTIRTNKKIKVAVTSPTGEGYAARFTLDNAAVATSGNYERCYIFEGVKYHHIIGPDGYPAGLNEGEPILSATVVGKEGALCDALSTLVFIEGAKSEALLKKLGYSALIITQNTYKVIGDIDFEILEPRQAA